MVKRLLLTLLAVAALAACGPTGSDCSDGTHSSSTGRGTCSGHGGVAH